MELSEIVSFRLGHDQVFVLVLVPNVNNTILSLLLLLPGHRFLSEIRDCP